MMKQFVSIILALCFLGALPAQSIFETQEKEVMKKNGVKTKIQMDHKYVNGVLSTQGYVSSITSFDENGNPTEIVNYRSNGSIISIVNYEYDALGNKTNYTRYKGNREKISYQQGYRYDANGRKIEESGYDGASKYKNIYSYDAQNRISQIQYFAGDFLQEKRVFTYHGANESIKVYDSGGELTMNMERKYDAKGQLTEHSQYLPDATLTNKLTYVYDGKGNIIEETKYMSGKLAYRTMNKYNEDQLVEVVKEEETTPVFITNKYKYDENGYLIEELWKKDNSKEYSTKSYTYDSQGKCTAIDCYFASYKFKVQYKLSYKM